MLSWWGAQTILLHMRICDVSLMRTEYIFVICGCIRIKSKVSREPNWFLSTRDSCLTAFLHARVFFIIIILFYLFMFCWPYLDGSQLQLFLLSTLATVSTYAIVWSSSVSSFDHVLFLRNLVYFFVLLMCDNALFPVLLVIYQFHFEFIKAFDNAITWKLHDMQEISP